MPSYSLKHLPDDLLKLGLESSASDERQTSAVLLAHIAEFDTRSLFLPTENPSMFRYCVDKLRMSEDIAYRYVHVARVARRFPLVFDAVADGRLNLSGVTLLARHLTRTNGHDLLVAAMRRTRAEIQALIARRFPESGLASRAIPTDSAACLGPPVIQQGEIPADARAPLPADSAPREHAPGRVENTGILGGPVPIALPELQVRVRPIAPGRFELVAVIDQQAHDELMASKDLLGHVIPSSALVEVLQRAIRTQFAQLRKRRCAATERPRTSAAEPPRSPHRDPRKVTNATRRAVWERDGGRCAFVSADGHRCESRKCLELDHVVPVARGGQSTIENLRLLCRPHNQHVAECEFGKSRMAGKREAAKSQRTAERMRKQAERGRAEARKAELARQSEEIGEALRTLGYRGTDLSRALALCAARPESPPEARLRYALQCMAPHTRRESPAPSASPSGVGP